MSARQYRLVPKNNPEGWSAIEPGQLAEMEALVERSGGEFRIEKVNGTSSPVIDAPAPATQAASGHTRFPDKFAKSKTDHDDSWDHFCEWLIHSPPTAADKHHLPFAKLAVFGEVRSEKDCLRTNANVLAVTGCELDLDNCVLTFDQVVERLENAMIEALVLTSASFVPVEREKVRVFLPFSKPLKGSTAHMDNARANAVARSNGLLGGNVADESFTLSQSYYVGKVNEHYRAVRLKGRTIDAAKDLDAGAIGKAKAALKDAGGTSTSSEGDSAPYEALIGQIVRGEHYHTAMIGLTAKLAGSKTPRHVAEGIVRGLFDAAADRGDKADHEAEIERTLASAYTKFFTEPSAIEASDGALIQTVQQVLEMGSGVALVRNVIYAGTFVLFAGKWKAGKSFLTLDMVLALSRSLEQWFGHETIGRRCRVLYINAEGSLSLRLRAYLKKHNLTHADIDSHFFAVTKRLKLNKEGGKKLLRIIEQHEAAHGAFDIVVVDTVARALDGNENSPEDMGAFVDSCEHIIGENQRTLIAVHHLGKDESRGSRGHSSLPAAVAGQIDIERNEASGIRTWSVAFQRDSEEVSAQAFMLEQVDLGPDPTSRRDAHLSSVVVVPCEAPPARRGDPGGQPGTALGYLRELVDAAGGPVPFEDWRAKCYDAKLGDGDADSQRQAFNRAKSKLVKAARISISGDMVTLLEITSVTSKRDIA